MADWDTTNPDDNDIVSQYPSNERAARTAVVANFGVDHHETNDADVGKHEVIQILDNEGNATIAAGQIGIWNDGGVLKTRVGAGAVQQLARVSDVSGAAFPSGTRMLFHQANPPTGWTQVTNFHDRLIRIVNGNGGGVGGNWTISGMFVQGHVLTVGQMPQHDHGGGGNTGLDGAHGHTGTTTNNTHNHTVPTVAAQDAGNGTPKGHDTNNVDSSTTTSNNTHNHGLNISNAPNHRHTYTINSQGNNQAHNHGITHNGNWRPAYNDVILGAKD